ncbi:Mu transposase C-terminal domain-containing protein [Gluconacetobacter tumulisoli]|uniref:Transposase n=1 Tax=Gluconacetobacter tumulisoli TaxID=1286189 RepID=A0A7W4K763_9PROT|nr:Mu transposase C-terminal domain-containing protein [Gluconacetobacter tumulisoli]MBB2201650.1 transposase [Gluconacetobacter tumulisoli]
MTPNPRFLDISKGAMVQVGQARYRIEAQTSEQTVLAQKADDGRYETLRIATLSPATETAAVMPNAHDLVADAPAYATAQQRLEIIRPLVGAVVRPRSQVEAVAASAGRSVRTIYNWLSAYHDAPQLSSLIPTPRGPAPGQKTLDPRLDAIIDHAIETNLKVPQRKRVSHVIEAVEDACQKAGIEPPHANTIRRRVKTIPRAELLQSQGRSDEADAFRPMIGSLPGAVAPLSIVQIDHSEADVMIVDEALRLPLNRPWITVAIDVHTRMIVGLVVSMEAPSAFAAGRCIAQAMTPKDEYLREQGVPGDWPAYGKPHIVHMDNAKEFRGEVLKTACAEYGIDIQFRRVKTPRYGGHIERLMRTLGEAIRELPGATFSNPKERTGYDSDAKAVMTLAEFESWLVDHVVNRYHQQPHSRLDGMPPIEKWRQGIERIGLPRPPSDPQRLQLDFLPFEWRTMGRRGIIIDHLHYYENELRHWIGRTDPGQPKQLMKFLIRVDPRDISRVWFLDPDRREYLPISTLDKTRPPISRWEWKAVQRQLRSEGAKAVDEPLLFSTYDRLRKRAEESAIKTKAARKVHQRAADTRRHAASARKPSVRLPAGNDARKSDAPAPTTKVPSLFDIPVEPFDDIDA